MGKSIIQQAQELHSIIPELNVGNVIGYMPSNGNGIVLHQSQHLSTAAVVTHIIHLNREETQALYEWLQALHKEQ